MPARNEMPSTISRSSKRAQEIWSKTHDSAVETYGEACSHGITSCRLGPVGHSRHRRGRAPLVKDLITHGHRVYAVGSGSQVAAESFAAEFGIPTACGSYAELAADPDIDVVYVATPHNFHAANAILALENGKHVLVEETFTMTQAQAREVTGLAEQRGLS